MGARQSDELVLTNAIVVLENRVIDRGTVAVANGIVTEISDRTYPPGSDAIDLDGRLLIPGIVDLHNDAIEREVNPRPMPAFRSPTPIANSIGGSFRRA